ncbi:FAD binding domain-containing protein [Streptomyces sp. NPDC046870]|uniref:FAD binding domain-containing protein n=1 Tax=Streptomyces sp. NPDC046870 TaxID=3155135 RepID=UPI0034526AAA
MKPVEFRYHAPATLEHALDLLADTGPGAVPLAGGQSLVPQLNARHRRPSAVIDLGGVPGLDTVAAGPAGVRIGARTRLAAVADDPLVRRRLPVLSRAALSVAHHTVRQRATLGGSLCHADPAAELPAVTLALDARLVLVSRDGGERAVRAVEFFTGRHRTALRAGELLVAVEFPPAPGFRFAFDEVTRRGAAGFPLVALCLGVTTESGVVTAARLAAAGVADTPVRPAAVEDALRGLRLDGDLGPALDAVGTAVRPPADQHGDARYRTALLRALLRRCAAHLTHGKADDD